MSNIGDFCSWSQTGETVVVVLLQEFGSLDWQHFGELTDEIVGLLTKNKARDIVVDLSNTKMIGSETIGFLIRLRSVALKTGGRMALCGVSEIEMETLKAMRLEQGFWHICSNRCAPTPTRCAECPEFVTSCLCDD